MFNDNASDLDRQKKLQELIRNTIDDDDNEDSRDEDGNVIESEIPSFE